MPAKKSSDSKDMVMDVNKPGEAEANASSRPIIVTRKPIVQDPMMRGDQGKSEVPGSPVLPSKPERLRKFLTPKQDNGSVAAEGEIDTKPVLDEPGIEEKIAEAKIKVDAAGAKTIAEEKPTELKILDGNTDEAEPEESAEVKTDRSKTKAEEKPEATSLPASVKEMIEPEDVHISAAPEDSESTDEEPAEKTESTGKKVITPTASSPAKPTGTEKSEIKDMNDAPSEETAKALAAATVEKAGKEKTKENAEPSENETPEADDPNKEQKSGGLVDELAKQAANKKTKDKEEKEVSVKEQKINKLVADKTYFLPIGQVTRKRKNRNSLLIVLLLLIILGGAYAAADARLINSPIELPYEFIQDQQ